MKKVKNEGITLIALVVTIVVLLILAGISIAMLTGDDGIITKAREAKNAHDESSANETAKMDEVANKMNQYYTGGGSSSDDEEIPLPEGWDGDKVNPVKSEDNVVVPVPKGYTVSTVEDENKVSTGFVIKEGDNGEVTEGINEFVWVPVSDITDIYDEANQRGVLWKFVIYDVDQKTYVALNSTVKNTDDRFREPEVVTESSSGSVITSGRLFDAISANLQQAGLSASATVSEFKTQLQTEFKEMIDSVKTYGGFFIGRYETGNLSQEKAVVQKNNEDIGDQTWYTMYKVCKTIKANENVKTSMIWGCQWDATMRWMQTSSNLEVANFPTNSEGKGNHKGTQGTTNIAIPTGSNSTYAVNNIYDMAGNVAECTLEALENSTRIIKGGSYNDTAAEFPVSTRDYGINPNNHNSVYGCRATLYIN